MRYRRLLIFHRPWLLFSLIKVGALGIYGILLHASRIAMVDPTHAQYKTLLFAGVGFSLVAIVGSSLILKFKGVQWRFPIKGMVLATLAGVASGTTALGILLAFQAEGTPAVVMTILFTGASLINAVVALTIDTPEAGGLRWQFIVGLQLAILGICMVTIYRPGM
ncbi:hypothetical protein F4X33_21375 [Candidatus Poribacteria bacterium]|nr:hypothetical protein [Candidatus Poribacteria bacterium]